LVIHYPYSRDCHGEMRYPTVFVNGRPLARIGDAISCGSQNSTGSSNVIANG
nr:PAAR domain-containing protein [Candidatus Brocadiales bacterium]